MSSRGGGGRSRRPAPAAPGPWLPFEARGAKLVWLGWDEPVLHAAARWILAELGSDLGDVLVALPGARAARRLRELLAESAPADWTPPRVLTQGELIDELVRLERPAAGRLTRTLVWERALEDLSDEERGRLARPRAGGGAGERLRLAETVRTLHGELAPEGRDFSSLASGSWAAELEGEARRWQALGKAQASYRARLARLGLVDPHEGRLQAIEGGAFERERRVVLVAVADMTHLLARLLEELAERVTALVAAPEELRTAFDGFGRLLPAVWKARDVPLPLASWRVAEKPVDQAETVRGVLEEWRGEIRADELTLGIADESVVPYLERQLAECGARARRAAGTPVEHTRPFRLLRALARFLHRRSFTELASLARDPDLGALLAPGADPAAAFDAYFGEHLPRHAGDWIGERSFERTTRDFHERLGASLGALGSDTPRPLAEWSQPIRAWLAPIFPRSLSEASEPERLLAESLRRVGAVLAELEEVPATLELAAIGPADALDLVLRVLRGQRIPPPPVEAAGTVELVGWLDLPLDDAPALILTGFNEGKVPQSSGAHPFLPDSLRKRLGLPGDEERLARDAYAATVLLATRARAVFVTARRSAEGDPLTPSRLAFHCPEAEVPARVRRFLPPEGAPPERVADEGPVIDHARPIVPGWSAPTRLSVSAFRAFLASPYGFYLQQVLRLDTRDDRTNELDPRRFGTFAHAVLQDFGQSGPHASSDPEEVAEFLVGALRRRAADEFGPDPLPAVGLQLEQLEYRLKAFASRQAVRAAEGWRIHAVEWKPPQPVLLEVDGEPVEIAAKLDRVDRHPDGRWAILDYKTGEKKRTPREAHRRRDGTWTDLQLPLYRFVARGLGLSGEPELGYVHIGKDEADTDFFVEPWSADEHEEALEVARDVVRAVRAGQFAELNRPPYEEILKAICGESTLGADSGGTDAGEGLE